jgi:hypothetical protein
MKRYLIPLGLFVAAGAYYWRQACPTFYYWDSAELTAAVLGGGVPHPPGFPFFLIVSRIWQFLVPLSSFFSLNIFSAFFGALGLVIWYLVMVRTLRLLIAVKSEPVIWMASILAVALMAVSLTYSIQATRYEVYSFNFAGFAGLVLICLKIMEGDRPSAGWSIALFILLGFFLAVHNLTIALAIPGLLLFLLLDKKIALSYAILGTAGAILLSGLFYLTLLIRASGNPPLNWGDPSNLGRLSDYILIRGFSVSGSRLSLSHLGAQLGFAYDVIYRQIGAAAMVLALFGLGYSIRRSYKIGVPLAVILILNLLSVAFAENYFYENYDLHGYLMIALAISILFLGLAFLTILKYMLVHFGGRKAGVARSLAVALFLIFAMLVMTPSIRDNFMSADLSLVRGAEEYGRRFLADAPPNAVIITSSYNTYFCALAYRAGAMADNGKTVLNLYNWDHDWGRELSSRLLKFQSAGILTRQSFYRRLLNQTVNKRPVYVEYDQSSAPINRYLYPHGLGYIFMNPDASAAPVKNENDTPYLSLASKSSDLETVRTWVLWLQNRGNYYEQKGSLKDSQRYLSLIDILASETDLQ